VEPGLPLVEPDLEVLAADARIELRTPFDVEDAARRCAADGRIDARGRVDRVQVVPEGAHGGRGEDRRGEARIRGGKARIGPRGEVAVAGDRDGRVLDAVEAPGEWERNGGGAVVAREADVRRARVDGAGRDGHAVARTLGRRT